MSCLGGLPKLLYHNRAELISSVPQTYDELLALCHRYFPELLPNFIVFGVSATGRRQLCQENFREVMSGAARVKTFEVLDSSESDGVHIQPFCLVGLQCLHDTAFMVQSYSLDDFTLQSRCIETTRGFSYVVTSDSLVLSGGMEDITQKPPRNFSQMAIRYRKGFVEQLPDLLSPHCFHLSLGDDRNLLYIIGGLDRKRNATAKCELFDFASFSWTSLPILPAKVRTLTGCLLGSSVYILINSVVHCLSTHSWTPVLPLETKHPEMSMIPASGEEILIYGGKGSDGTGGITLIVNVGTATARSAPLIPAKGKLHYFKPARHRGRIYLYAGNVQTVLTYNVSEERWRFLSEEYWEMRKAVFFLCSIGRRGGLTWQVWKLPVNLLREVAAEYLCTALR